MRIWVDCTAAAHPLVLRPIIERLRDARARGRGHRARVRADGRASSSGSGSRTRSSARHGGGATAGKGLALARRSCALARWARPPAASTSRSPTARSTWPWSAPLLRIPLGADAGLRVRRACSASSRSAPRAGCSSPTRSRSRRCGARARAERKLFRYPGLKEDYYLADFEPDPAVLERARDRTASRCWSVVRPPPETSAYHADNPLYERGARPARRRPSGASRW